MANVSHGQYALFSDAEPAAAPDVAAAPVRVPVAPQPVALGEVLGFCPRLLSGLPEASTLVCELEGARVVITTSQVVYMASVATWPTLKGRELAALALAVEHDRGSPAAMAEWCARKRLEPHWCIEPPVAIGAIPGRFETLGSVTVGQTLAAFGLVLRAVGVGDEEPT